MTLVLNYTDLIGEGATQKCFKHPTNKNLCVKIPKEGINIKKLNNELRYYKKINKRVKEINYNFFSKFYYEIETSLGKGYVYDLVRDQKNGNVSKTLAHYLLEENKTFSDKILYEAFNRMTEMMIKYKIIMQDFWAVNICCRILKNNKIEMVIIDGLGHKDKIPLVDYSSFLSRKKIERRLKRNKFLDFDEQRKHLRTLKHLNF